MKVLCCIRSTIIHNPVGGMERISHSICKSLHEKGWSLTILSTSLKEDPNNNICKTIDGVEYIFLRNTMPCQYSNEYNNAIIEYLRLNNNINIIYSVSSGALALTKNKYKIPVIAAWHSSMISRDIFSVIDYALKCNGQLNPYNIEDFLMRFMTLRFPKMQTMLNKFDHHIATCDYMKSTINIFGIDNSQIDVLELGVPNIFSNSRVIDGITAKKKFNIDNNKICLGVVGRADPMKGHELMKSVLKKLTLENFSIFLIGPPENMKYYDGIKGKFTSRMLDHKDMPLAFRAMDLFIHPSLLKSNYDMVVKEAISCGTRTIAPEGPTYGDLFRKLNVKYGIKSPLGTFLAGNEKSLLDAIKRALKRDITRDFSFIDEYCSEKRMCDEYHILFTKFI